MISLHVVESKMIQLCGIKLQTLRVNLQNSQQQNRQLAQANSQILAVSHFICCFPP